MGNNYSESSFCKRCNIGAEIKVMCPLISPDSAGYSCVSLFHCKRCANHKGINLEECKVNCSYQRTGK